ncbi:predicted thiol-disulfide oxidoreductase YuxK, DCC family [Bacteroidales bacterium 6E]|nr:predicted thiol-disulfide oxidoreductase YuxK, DCC family [Bacteroidales bacterium 6E]
MTRQLVIFDGYCNLCNRSVDFIVKRDHQGIFRYVALQSEAGAYLSGVFKIPPEPQSVMLISDGKIYRQSDAALMIASKLKKPWSWLGSFRIVPKAFRDPVYNLVATHRYRWFGKRQVCRMPTEEERRLFPSVEELKLEFAGFKLPV